MQLLQRKVDRDTDNERFHLILQVHMSLPSDLEIQQILVERCPNLEMFIPRMIEMYRLVQERLSREPHCKRVVSLRDLVKLVSRYAGGVT